MVGTLLARSNIGQLHLIEMDPWHNLYDWKIVSSVNMQTAGLRFKKSSCGQYMSAFFDNFINKVVLMNILCVIESDTILNLIYTRSCRHACQCFVSFKMESAVHVGKDLLSANT